MITYFVHSTSLDNETGRRAGWNDPPLSTAGVEQARALKGLISGLQFDAVYSSDMERAMQTAKIALPDANVQPDSRLRELNYGRLNGAPVSVFPPDELWCVNNRFAGGESCLDVQARIEEFLADIYTTQRSIAVFSHRYPQLALEVVMNGVTWQNAIESDWRRSGEWQPGWTYALRA